MARRIDFLGAGTLVGAISFAHSVLSVGCMLQSGLRLHLWYVGRMNIAIPREFEAIARERVRTGIAASEEEAAVTVLREYAAGVEAIREMLDPAFAELERGETVDGEAFMREFIQDTRAICGE